MSCGTEPLYSIVCLLKMGACVPLLRNKKVIEFVPKKSCDGLFKFNCLQYFPYYLILYVRPFQLSISDDNDDVCRILFCA